MKLKPDFDKQDLISELKNIRNKYNTMAENPYLKEYDHPSVYKSSYSVAALDDAVWILKSRKDDFSIGRWTKCKDDNGFPKFCCSKCCGKIDFAYDFCPHCGNQKRMIVENPL